MIKTFKETMEQYDIFAKDFPSLTNDDWDEIGGYTMESIQDKCRDVQTIKKIIKTVQERRAPRLKEGMDGGCNLDDEEEFVNDLLKEFNIKE